MWNRQEISFPIFQAVESVIAEEHARRRLPLPNFSGATELLAASDYSGDHKASKYQLISCLITSRESSQAWEGRRSLARHVQQVKDRRIRYSDLRDPAQERMLAPFLTAGLMLHGLLCCLAVDKSLRSLIDPRGKIDVKHPQLEAWQHWKAPQFERMLRIASLVSILLVGLSRPDQSMRWVTDEDEIAGNQTQLERLASGLAAMIFSRAPHHIPAVECATAITDSGAFETEDLVTLPDLVGGALADLLTGWKNAGVSWSTKLQLLVPDTVPAKARPILNWFFSARGALTRVLIVIFPTAIPGEIQVKLIPQQ